MENGCYWKKLFMYLNSIIYMVILYRIYIISEYSNTIYYLKHFLISSNRFEYIRLSYLSTIVPEEMTDAEALYDLDNLAGS